MNAQNGYVRAVNRSAHVEAAGQGDAQLGRQLMAVPVIKQVIHYGLYNTRCVNGRCVAVNPALGVDNIGYSCSGPSNGELV